MLLKEYTYTYIYIKHDYDIDYIYHISIFEQRCINLKSHEALEWRHNGRDDV